MFKVPSMITPILRTESLASVKHFPTLIQTFSFGDSLSNNFGANTINSVLSIYFYHPCVILLFDYCYSSNRMAHTAVSHNFVVPNNFQKWQKINKKK